MWSYNQRSDIVEYYEISQFKQLNVSISYKPIKHKVAALTLIGLEKNGCCWTFTKLKLNKFKIGIFNKFCGPLKSPFSWLWQEHW